MEMAGGQRQDVKVENSIPAPVCVSPTAPTPSADKQRDSAGWLIKLDETHLSPPSLHPLAGST